LNLLNRLIRLNRLVAHQNRNNIRLKNISKNLTAKLTVNRINRLLRLKRFGSVRLIGFGYILPILPLKAAAAISWGRSAPAAILALPASTSSRYLSKRASSCFLNRSL